MARQREEVVTALASALSDWRRVLEFIAACESAEEAQEALARSFSFTRVQAIAVMDTQFRRVTQVDRERIADELVQLRREIDELGGDAE
jgi:DNA gyrase subunit A